MNKDKVYRRNGKRLEKVKNQLVHGLGFPLGCGGLPS